LIIIEIHPLQEQLMDINVQEIIRQLGPYSGLGLVWNIMIYLVFFLNLISLFLQSDKTLLPTLVLAAGLLICIIAKLVIFNPMEFGTFVVNAAMFLAPTLVIGMTKAPKSRPLLILASIISGIYFFAFWVTFHFRNPF
jgi:hypothetical protein